MKIVSWVLFLAVSTLAFGQEVSNEIKSASKNNNYNKASRLFAEGKYLSTIEELNDLEKYLIALKQAPKATIGFINYWKGIVANRIPDYALAIDSFKITLQNGYNPIDLPYEYGQALFASEKLLEAREQFSESYKKEYKRGVSLYYAGFISKELGESKEAIEFFQKIETLPTSEYQEIAQASQMQLGDLYLEEVEKAPDAFRSMEKKVIPQYEKALSVNEESALAPKIKEKIIAIQRKYELVLFNLRNGRPTINPPYFLRISEEVAYDTNVTFSPSASTIAKSHQGSLYSKTDFLGRYTFYVKNFISIAPEFRFNYTRYLNRVSEIYTFDNTLVAPAVRTAHEHSLWNKPAAFLFDFDWNEAKRDIEAEKELIFSSNSKTFMFGERFNIFSWGESILRVRQRQFASYLPASNSKTTSLVYEQIKTMKENTLLFYTSFDKVRGVNKLFDTNAITFRTDLILPRYREWFTPSFGLSLTTTDPINDRIARGRELLINPSTRLSKTFAKRWRANFKYEFQKNFSKKSEAFAFQKHITGFEFEYLF